MRQPLFFQAEDGIRDVERSRGLGDVYKRQDKQSSAQSYGVYPKRYALDKKRHICNFFGNASSDFLTFNQGIFFIIVMGFILCLISSIRLKL